MEENKVKGLEVCQKIKILQIWDFKEINFQIISKLSGLNELDIRTGSIKTAEGLEPLSAIEKILFGNCRSLRFIKQINNKINLKSLHIESCSQIEDYDCLNNLPGLETLSLINCKKIKSIKLIKEIPSLKKLVILWVTQIF